jgi:hypothetical protein
VSELGAAGVAAKDWTNEDLDRKSEAAIRAGIRPGDRWKGQHWTPEQDALLGADHDEVIAETIRRTAVAVRCRRTRKGIKKYVDRRCRGAGLPPPG